MPSEREILLAYMTELNQFRLQAIERLNQLVGNGVVVDDDQLGESIYTLYREASHDPDEYYSHVGEASVAMLALDEIKEVSNYGDYGKTSEEPAP